MTRNKLKDVGYISKEGSMDYELKITKEQKEFNNWF